MRILKGLPFWRFQPNISGKKQPLHHHLREIDWNCWWMFTRDIENCSTLGMEGPGPLFNSPQRAPLKGDILHKYPHNIRCIKGPPFEGFSHHFPYEDICARCSRPLWFTVPRPRRWDFLSRMGSEEWRSPSCLGWKIQNSLNMSLGVYMIDILGTQMTLFFLVGL